MGIDLRKDLEGTDWHGPEAPLHYSFSQCRTFSMCPQKWFNSKVLRKPQRPSYQMLSGKAVHQALEAHNLMKKQGKAGLKGGELVDLSVSVLTGYDGLSEVELPSGDIVDTFVKDITSPTGHYLTHSEAQVWRDGDPALVQVEQEIVWEVGGIPFVGYIDLNPDRAPLVDYKLTKRRKSEQQISHDPQMALYAQVVGKPAAFMQLMRGRPVSVYAEQAWEPRVMNGVAAWIEQCVKGMEQARETGIVQRCTPGDWMCSPAQCEFYHECYTR